MGNSNNSILSPPLLQSFCVILSDYPTAAAEQAAEKFASLTKRMLPAALPRFDRGPAEACFRPAETLLPALMPSTRLPCLRLHLPQDVQLPHPNTFSTRYSLSAPGVIAAVAAVSEAPNPGQAGFPLSHT